MVGNHWTWVRATLGRLWLAEPLPQMLALLRADPGVETVLAYVRLSGWTGREEWWVGRRRDGTAAAWRVTRPAFPPPRLLRRNSRTRSAPRPVPADALARMLALVRSHDFWTLPSRIPPKAAEWVDGDWIGVACADRRRCRMIGGDAPLALAVAASALVESVEADFRRLALGGDWLPP